MNKICIKKTRQECTSVDFRFEWNIQEGKPKIKYTKKKYVTLLAGLDVQKSEDVSLNMLH